MVFQFTVTIKEKECDMQNTYTYIRVEIRFTENLFGE